MYASGQRRYWEFCRVNRLPPFPLPEDQLCTCVAHLVDEGLQYSSVKGYLSANRRLQIVQGMRDPFVSSWPLLEYALCGVKLHQARSRDTRAKKHLPVTTDILNKLKCFWSSDNSNFDYTIFMLLGHVAMCCYDFLRSGEITIHHWQSLIQTVTCVKGMLPWIHMMPPLWSRVRIKTSKMDPFRRGVFMFMGKTSNELCPVAAISAYLVVRGRTSGPFFHFNLGSPLSREMFVKHVRRALSAQGVDASSYSGHSFCTGAATAAAAAGLEDSLIKTLGRWQSAA